MLGGIAREFQQQLDTQTQRVPPPFTGPKAEVGNEIQKPAKHSVARQYLINQL